MKIVEVATLPVVSLEEFARAVADKSPTADELGRRAAAYLDTLARPARPKVGPDAPRATPPIDLGPSIRAAARDRAIEALVAAIDATELPPSQRELISDPTHELHIPNPKRPG